MKKAEKPFVVEDLLKRLKDAKMVVAVDYSGLGVKEITKLREAIKEAGGRLIVVKNTLFKLALEKTQDEKGKTQDEKEKMFDGPTAVVFAEKDELAPLQVIGKFVKELELPKFKFGFFAGDFVDQEGLTKLSVLPSRDVLFGQLLSTLSFPLYELAGTLQGNVQKLVYVLDNFKRR